MNGKEGLVFAFLPQVNLDNRGTTIKFRALEKESTYLVKIDKMLL